MKPLSFAWRTLRREFRYGELATLAIALILAVAALGAVATLGERVQRSVVASAAEFIGGDVGLSSREPPSDALKDEAARLNLRTSTAATFPTVLFSNGKSQLADIRAADASYPLRGELRVRSASGAEFAAHTPPAGSVYAEQRLLAALDLKTGDDLQIGDRTLHIAGEIEREPDGGELFALAPRVVMSLDDARAGGLLGVGSRARYRFMAAGDERAVADFTAFIKSHKPDSGELITVEQSQQNLKSAFDRGDAFLRLAALLAALLSGIAVALASQRYARRKTDEVALLRCLGASGGEVTLAIATTLAMLAVPACAIGALLGLGLQQVVFTLAKDLLPVASNVIPLGPTLASFAVGLAVLFGFSLPPLLRLRDVPPVRIFQRAAGARVRRFDFLYLIPFAVSALLIFVESDTPKLATILSASLFGVAAVALLAGSLLMRIVRHARGLAGALRFGLANLARRRALSLLQIVALALAITALDLLAVVGPSLLSAWRAELPPDTPNYFLINIQPEQLDGVTAALKESGRGKREHAAARGEQTRRHQRQGAARGGLSGSPRRRLDQRRNAHVVERGRAAVESRDRRTMVRAASVGTADFGRRNVDRDVPSETRRHAHAARRRSRHRRAHHQRARRALGFVPREFFPAARSGQRARHFRTATSRVSICRRVRRMRWRRCRATIRICR